MNVSLTPELEKFVSAKVGSGRYNSASEVVREAPRLLEEHDSAPLPSWPNSTGSLADASRRLIAARRLTLSMPAPGCSVSPQGAESPARERLHSQRRCGLRPG